MPRYHKADLPLNNGVVACLLLGVDAYCPAYGTDIWPSMLHLERPVLGGLLVEYKRLMLVNPTWGASIELVDGGKRFRYSDGCVTPTRGEKTIVRIFDCDWNSKSNSHCETINRPAPAGN